MLTPGGRERLRRMQDRTSPTPSPSKLRMSRSTSALTSRYPQNDTGDDEMILDDDEEDEDDEETLQLKLQAIQAKLKLKKLQAAKSHKKTASRSEPLKDDRPSTAPEGNRGMVGVPLQSKLAAVRDRMENAGAQGNGVQVPASPVRKAMNTADLERSPSRVLLGIDKGRKAADMSLKRAPIPRSQTESRLGQQGGYLQRSKTPGAEQANAPRPMSFNERLAAARSDEQTQLERKQRIEQSRSTSFAISREEMEDYKAKAVELPHVPSRQQEFSRDEVLSAMGRNSGGLPQSRTAPNLQGNSQGTSSTDTSEAGAAFEPYSGLHLSKRILPHNKLARTVSGKKIYMIKDLLKQVKAPNFELPDVEGDIVVFGIVASKSDPRSHQPKANQDPRKSKYMVITLVDLTWEIDLFLFNTGFDRWWKLTPGTVVAILNPNTMAPRVGYEATNKWSLIINSDADMILEIGTARDLGYCKSVQKDGSLCRSWLNARRTEYCEYHTNQAVTKARTGRIEMNQTSFGSGGGERKLNSRMGYAAKKAEEEQRKRGSNYDRFNHSQFFVSRNAGDIVDEESGGSMADRVEREEGLKRRLAHREREREIAKKLGEIGGGAGKDYMSRAAAAAPSVSFPQPTSSRARAGSKSTLASSVSSSAVFSAAAAATSSSQNTTPASGNGSDYQLPGHAGRKWDPLALGLVREKGAQQPKVELGPVKRKRRTDSSASSTTAPPPLSASASTGSGIGNKPALGWGVSLKDKLAKMKDGERLDGTRGATVFGNQNLRFQSSSDQQQQQQQQIHSHSVSFPPPNPGTASRGDHSPVRKKTRFVTDKGIREAGRESLGGGPFLSAAATSAGGISPTKTTFTAGGTGTAAGATKLPMTTRRRVVIPTRGRAGGISGGGGGGGGGVDLDDDDDLIIV